MRFVEAGPNIPTDLIEAQRKGELLFFCGAGVSVPAGLPNFSDLTKNVAKKLHAFDNPEVKKMIQDNQFDRTFSKLRRDFTEVTVDNHVLSELRIRRDSFLDNHSNLLTLSVNENGTPFLITTNFDRLFEQVNKKITYYVPPYLPDPQAESSLSGLVYLHGRWNQPSKIKKNNLILSSQDFGRAYLSNGWAARFLSSILRRRTVVLIGYSGDDTLVRYLLEGLNAESSSNKSHQIYAFERGIEPEIETKWSEIGGKGVAYSDHEKLWKTIEKWAYFAKNPIAWDEHIAKLSQSDPKSLRPHERGQVAFSISTKRGAQKFFGLEPKPNAEWICVFDRKIRLALPQKYKTEAGEEIEIDPIDLYGLDDDPTRSQIEMLENYNDVGSLGSENFLENLKREKQQILAEKFSNLEYLRLWQVDSRISVLLKWFISVANQPAAIWWAQHQYSLHPLILEGVQRRLEDNINSFSTQSINFWKKNIYLQKKRHSSTNYTDLYSFQNNIAQMGFSFETLEEFYKIIEPSLSLSNNALGVYPPENENDENLFPLFEVICEEFDDSFEIKDEWLKDVLLVLSKVLTKIVQLEVFIDYPSSWFQHFDFPSLSPLEDDDRSNTYHNKLAEVILWTSKLILRLIDFDSASLLQVINAWPQDEIYIFDRLRIFVWSKILIVPSEEILSYLTNLSEELFWNRYVESEIILMLENRWNDFNHSARESLEQKIIQFRSKLDWETEDEYSDRKIYQVGRLLGKLDNTEIGLTKVGSDKYFEIIHDKKWENDFLNNKSIKNGIYSGVVETDISSDDLKFENAEEFFQEVELKELDKEKPLIQYKPFLGVLKKDPDKVFSLILEEMKIGKNHEKYWHQFFSYFPENSNESFILKVAESTLLLSNNVIFELRFVLPRWVSNHLIKACINNHNFFWKVWDNLFKQLNQIGSEATRSSLGQTLRGGKAIRQSRKTLTHALNAPIGQLIDLLFETYKIWKLTPKMAREYYLSRLEIALFAVGEGSDNATTMIMLRFRFLFSEYPEWSKKILLPMLNFEHKNAEAAWRGLISQDSLSGEIFKIIKPYLLKLIDREVLWEEEESFWQRVAHYTVLVAYWSYPKQRYLSNNEARKIIRSFNDNGRSQALWMFYKVISENKCWNSFGRYFFRNIWPQEQILQTSRTSERLLLLAQNNLDQFPDIVNFIEPFLRPSDSHSRFIYRLSSEEKSISELVELYPEETLRVINSITPVRLTHPHPQLQSVLARLAESKPNIKNLSAWRRLDEVSS